MTVTFELDGKEFVGLAALLEMRQIDVRALQAAYDGRGGPA